METWLKVVLGIVGALAIAAIAYLVYKFLIKPSAT
jgi:hypothetical protein